MEPHFSSADITNRLPHRYPFVLIDRIIATGPNFARAIKNVTINEWYFAGHFPADPIMPGVLICEAIAQTAAFIGVDLAVAPTPLGRRVVLSEVNIKFRRPVLPGDQLHIETITIKQFGQMMRVSANAAVENRQVAGGEITVSRPT